MGWNSADQGRAWFGVPCGGVLSSPGGWVSACFGNTFTWMGRGHFNPPRACSHLCQGSHWEGSSLRSGVTLGAGTGTKARSSGSRFAHVWREAQAGGGAGRGLPAWGVRLQVPMFAGVKGEPPSPAPWQLPEPSNLSICSQGHGAGPQGPRPSLSDDIHQTPSPSFCSSQDQDWTPRHKGALDWALLSRSHCPGGEWRCERPLLIHQVRGWDGSSLCEAGGCLSCSPPHSPGQAESWPATRGCSEMFAE